MPKSFVDKPGVGHEEALAAELGLSENPAFW
jgi:hypothetical protein